MADISKHFKGFLRRRLAGIPITHHLSLVTGAALLLALAGCSTPRIFERDFQADYFDDNLRYEHPFRDAAFESVRKDAERECGRRKQVAMKAPGTCTLDRCVTNYQCIKQSGTAEYNK